ncbi:MAG: lyase family protein, partial [Pseudomonadota bacterium]
MILTPLSAICPVDGRYRKATEPLADYFSEGALIRYRVATEIAYFIALSEIPLPPLAAVSDAQREALRQIPAAFTEDDASAVKAIERTTNHDVKAVEYFLKERFDALGLGASKEFIHFALTSQDINNTAVPASLRDGWRQVMRPNLV